MFVWFCLLLYIEVKTLLLTNICQFVFKCSRKQERVKKVSKIHHLHLQQSTIHQLHTITFDAICDSLKVIRFEVAIEESGSS